MLVFLGFKDTQMDNNRKIVSIAAIILLLVALGLIGWYYFKGDGKSNDIESSSANVPSSVPTPTPEPTPTPAPIIAEPTPTPIESNVIEKNENTTENAATSTPKSEAKPKPLYYGTSSAKSTPKSSKKSDNKAIDSKNDTENLESNVADSTDSKESNLQDSNKEDSKSMESNVADSTDSNKNTESNENKTAENNLQDSKSEDSAKEDSIKEDSTKVAQNESNTKEENILDSKETRESTQESTQKDSTESTESSQKDSTQSVQEDSTKSTQKESTESTESTQNESQDIAQNEDSKTEKQEDSKQTSTQDSKEQSAQDSKESAQNTQQENTKEDSKQEIYSGKYCKIAPKCNYDEVSKALVFASLQNHAMIRASEELEANGSEARDKFLQVWDETKDSILPKLTSHIGDVRDFGLSADGSARSCNANYYTEVLEDFGEKWNDKKGDLSPIYNADYQVACENNAIKVYIIKDSVRETNMSYASFNNGPQSEMDYSEPPKCNDAQVHTSIVKFSFENHALSRANEQESLYGEEAKTAFMDLWEKTQDIVTPKLASRISDIHDLGLSADKSTRSCSATYYTEVLEDFENGWTDKKGDKSPTYLIYYTIKYDDKQNAIVDITSEDRVQ